jgi:hypothetical protein
MGATLGQYLAVVVTLVTSAAAIGIGFIHFDLEARGLRIGLLRLLDCVWTVMVFFAANVLLSIGLVAAGRMLGAGPISSYTASDLMLVVVSAVQGMAFHLWREAGRGRPPRMDATPAARRRRRSPPPPPAGSRGSR